MLFLFLWFVFVCSLLVVVFVCVVLLASLSQLPVVVLLVCLDACNRCCNRRCHCQCCCCRSPWRCPSAALEDQGHAAAGADLEEQLGSAVLALRACLLRVLFCLFGKVLSVVFACLFCIIRFLFCLFLTVDVCFFCFLMFVFVIVFMCCFLPLLLYKSC